MVDPPSASSISAENFSSAVTGAVGLLFGSLTKLLFACLLGLAVAADSMKSPGGFCTSSVSQFWRSQCS